MLNINIDVLCESEVYCEKIAVIDGEIQQNWICNITMIMIKTALKPWERRNVNFFIYYIRQTSMFLPIIICLWRDKIFEDDLTDG